MLVPNQVMLKVKLTINGNTRWRSAIVAQDEEVW